MDRIAALIASDLPTTGNDQRGLWTSRITGFFGLLLLAVTWRLWTPQVVFPQVPLLAAACDMPTWFDWLGLGLLIACFIGLLFSKRVPIVLAITLTLVAGGMIVLDQHRIQPWLYQIVLLVVFLSAGSTRRELSWCRLLLISIYFFSALSKFDHTFLHTLGQQFLWIMTRFFGATPGDWSMPLRLVAAGAFPLGELLLAIGLSLPRTRRVAAAAGIGLHGALLLLLGPWGLRHHVGVLVWNGLFIGLLWVLFLKRFDAETKISEPEVGSTVWSRIVNAGAMIILLLPLLEPFGYCDHWLSWQLYAPRNSRVEVFVYREQADDLPMEMKPYLSHAKRQSPWVAIDLDQWSLGTLSVPIYPQDRFQMGVARAFADRVGPERTLLVIRQEVADRWTGKRKEQTIRGAVELEQQANDYLFSIEPRRY